MLTDRGHALRRDPRRPWALTSSSHQECKQQEVATKAEPTASWKSIEGALNRDRLPVSGGHGGGAIPGI